MYIKVHAFTWIPKNSVYPNPRALIFSLRRWHIPPSHRSDLAFGPLTNWGGVEGQREWGRESLLGVFSAQIIIKKPARHGGGGWRRLESIFRGTCLSPHRCWIDRKTARVQDFFFLAGLNALFYFLSYLFFMCWQLGRNRENRALQVYEKFRKQKPRNHILCACLFIVYAQGGKTCMDSTWAAFAMWPSKSLWWMW